VAAGVGVFGVGDGGGVSCFVILGRRGGFGVVEVGGWGDVEVKSGNGSGIGMQFGRLGLLVLLMARDWWW